MHLIIIIMSLESHTAFYFRCDCYKWKTIYRAIDFLPEDVKEQESSNFRILT